jgi:flagellar biosynthesis protein FlhA
VVVDAAVNSGEKPALLTSMPVRYHVHSIVDRIRINVPVVAQAEIHRRARVKVVGTI